MKKLSNIITTLCYNKQNLDNFIAELGGIVEFFSSNIKACLDDGLKKLQLNQEIEDDLEEGNGHILIIKAIDDNITGQDKLLKIFQII